MGQCTYYLKAVFKTPADAEAAVNPFRAWLKRQALIQEGKMAAGKTVPEDYGDSFDDFDVDAEAEALKFESFVWHGASWDPACAYLIKKRGAVRAGWVREEAIDPYDSIVSYMTAADVAA